MTDSSTIEWAGAAPERRAGLSAARARGAAGTSFNRRAAAGLACLCAFPCSMAMASRNVITPNPAVNRTAQRLRRSPLDPLRAVRSGGR